VVISERIQADNYNRATVRLRRKRNRGTVSLVFFLLPHLNGFDSRHYLRIKDLW
jgi:hypothetical protein